MHTPVLPGLVISRVQTDADIEAMISVRRRTDPDLPPPRLENLRHALEANRALTFLIARLDDAPVGCGFVETVGAPCADGHLAVIEESRQRGIGSALLADVSGRAAARGKSELQGEARESDAESRAYFERRGYRVVGGEQAVVLDLDAIDPEPAEPPQGVRIVTRAERPDVLEGMYDVSVEADEDIPGSEYVRSFEHFRAQDVDRPTCRAELCFVALAGDEVIGYALLDDYGADAHHGLTAVKREWRRRGVATALKRTQIAIAKKRGFRRLVTESEERNEPMRNLNLKLGYRPEPALSTVVLRGPIVT
jgi:mycothiol synthase